MSNITAINKIIGIRNGINFLKSRWLEEPTISANDILEWLNIIQKELED